MTERLMGHCRSTSSSVAGREMHLGDSLGGASRDMSDGEAGDVGFESIDWSHSLCADAAATTSHGRIMCDACASLWYIIIGAGLLVFAMTGHRI